MGNINFQNINLLSGMNVESSRVVEQCMIVHTHDEPTKEIESHREYSGAANN